MGIWRFVHDLFGDSGILGFRFFFSDLFRDLWILVLGVFLCFVSGFVFLAICLGDFCCDLFGELGIFFSRFVCLGIWGLVRDLFVDLFFPRFVLRFGDLLFFFFRDLFGEFGICLLVDLLRDLCGIWDLEICFFSHDLFGDSSDCFFRALLRDSCFFRDLFGDLWIYVFRDLVGDLWICFFRDLFGDLGIW